MSKFTVKFSYYHNMPECTQTMEKTVDAEKQSEAKQIIMNSYPNTTVHYVVCPRNEISKDYEWAYDLGMSSGKEFGVTMFIGEKLIDHYDEIQKNSYMECLDGIDRRKK